MVFIGDRFSRRKIFNGNVNNFSPPTCFLFDNGSLRPDATLALRRVAQRLAAATGLEVRPTSLLHSDRIDPAKLAGESAALLEPSLESFARGGGRNGVALPLFFGPSGAMRDYLPPRLDAIRAKYPNCRIELADCLESENDDSTRLLAEALKTAIHRIEERRQLRHPVIIVTDHGSPLPSVTAVRNRLGPALDRLKPSTWRSVEVASMERREGAEYDFNEPLLENALRTAAAAGAKEMVVAQQFLFPGRHAGPGGDIAEICRDFSTDYPETKVETTDPIGESDQILELLGRRLRQAINRSSSIR